MEEDGDVTNDTINRNNYINTQQIHDKQYIRIIRMWTDMTPTATDT